MSKSNHDLRVGAVASVVNDPDMWTYHEKSDSNIQGTNVNQSCIHIHTPDQAFTHLAITSPHEASLNPAYSHLGACTTILAFYRL